MAALLRRSYKERFRATATGKIRYFKPGDWRWSEVLCDQRPVLLQTRRSCALCTVCRPQTQAVGEGAAAQPAPGGREHPPRCLCSSHAKDGLYIGQDCCCQRLTILRTAETGKTTHHQQGLPLRQCPQCLRFEPTAIRCRFDHVLFRHSEPRQTTRKPHMQIGGAALLAACLLGSPSNVEVCRAHRLRVKSQ